MFLRVDKIKVDGLLSGMADPGRLDELERKFDENPRRYFAPLANEYRKAGDPERAIELCRTYLPQQPGHMSGYIVYGQALYDAGRGEEATAVFRQALTLDPENIIALRHLGDLARRAGDRAAAMQWYGKVLELDPRNEEIAGIITHLATPGAPAPPPGPTAPPPVRPEPEAPGDVALSQLLAEPDAPRRRTPAAPAPGAAPPRPRDGAERREEAPQSQPSPPPPPIVTETVAELYAAQGLTVEAIAVYRELVLTRDEPRWHARMAELEALRAGPGRSAARAAPRAAAEEPAPEPEPVPDPESEAERGPESTWHAAPEPVSDSESAPVAERAPEPAAVGPAHPAESPSASAPASASEPPPQRPRETVRDFFARIGAGRAAPVTEHRPDAPAGLNALFDESAVAGDDARAAAALAAAFADPHRA